jgi:O-antigen/teichoic acid export membrane protein
MNIRRNSLINLGGSVIGLILFAAMTPLYYQVIGGERYGILSIILAFMVFFVSFDFGMGAALSYRVAGEARGEPRRQSEYFWTATAISLPVGLAIGAVLFGMVGGGFGALFRLSEEVADELMKSVAWLFAMGIATVLQSTVGGLFKGREQFLVNATLGALGIIFSILFPVAAAIAFGPSLQNLIIATRAPRPATRIPTIHIAQ